MPKQAVAEMQVDPLDTMAARDQRAPEPVEKARNRALQKKKGASSAGPLADEPVGGGRDMQGGPVHHASLA
jgi:hypothetical protein